MACQLLQGPTRAVLDRDSISGTATTTLQPRAFTPLRTGSTTPQGWLAKQLSLQAEGLTGHLSLFWADVEDSSWIGGKADEGLHERTPYWLNGMVPLTYALMHNDDNSNTTTGMPPAKRPDTQKRRAGVVDCQNGTDMMYYDLDSFTVATDEECYDR